MNEQTGVWEVEVASSHFHNPYPHLTRDFEFTGRIKYSRDRYGEVSVSFEIERMVGEKQDEVTVGHLWWKRTYRPEPVMVKVPSWKYEEQFHYKLVPDEVIYGCQVQTNS